MLFIFFFSHTPSTVVTVSSQEHQQKVSVILCFVQTSPTELVAAENNLQKGKSILPYIYLGFIPSLLGLETRLLYLFI